MPIGHAAQAVPEELRKKPGPQVEHAEIDEPPVCAVKYPSGHAVQAEDAKVSE